jgi:CheY-like chemotaxis protein
MPKTLLLADDSVTIQKVVGITFANEDIELVTVDNGTDALSKAKQIFPDLVLADIGMPGMDGYELCAAIRRLPELSHVPVLLLTGTFESYDETRASSVGASGHISKPFEAQALVDRVWALLAETEAAQAATRVADPLERMPAAAPPLPAAAPAPAPVPTPAADPFADLPELPNSSFGASRMPAPPAGNARPPEPKASDLFDLGKTRPPLSPPLAEEDLPSRPERSALGPASENLSGGETAFLDPLQDLTPPLARPEPSRPALLPPAEAPDFLDLGRPDPQEDTNPTYADGSSISSDAEDPLDPGVASGESLAIVVPTAGHAPLVDAQELPEIDPLDLEPLEAPDPRDATLRATAPTLHGLEPRADSMTQPAPVAAPTLDGDALHGALEKIAWEAFGSLSQELVEQFTRRVEAIVWEVVPAVAERLVREEIARLKGES